MEYGYKEIAKDFKEIFEEGKRQGLKTEKENLFKEFMIRSLCWLGGFCSAILFLNWWIY